MKLNKGDFVYFVESIDYCEDKVPFQGYGIIDCFVNEDYEDEMYDSWSDEDTIFTVAIVKDICDINGVSVKGTKRASEGSLENGVAHLKRRVEEKERTLNNLKELLEKQGQLV